MAFVTLEDLLVQTHVLSPVQLAVAKRDAEMHRRRLAPTVVDLGLVDEARFAEWASQTSELPLMHPLPDDEAAAVAGRVPAAVARQYEVVPVGIDGDELTVATMDPFDRGAIELLHITTGMKIRPVVARHGELTRLVQSLYPNVEDDATPPPFEFGTETLLAAHRQPLAIGDDSVGNRTQIFTPRPDASEPSQLDRIEAQLASLARSIETLEKRIAAIDGTLSRVLSR
ncbi:MAG TPA: hypothetical protein VFT12_05070 [Thermoanaerobaculia bacterium]|nr:hypothetical protein [Thermoanaerobaculia bacterium]